MTREQYILATQQNNLPRIENPQLYPVGIYGWRKRCLYFFVLLLLVTMIVNLAMTIWILKVMNFTVDGMGNLRVTKKGIRLEGISEFLLPLYVKEIHSRKDSPLVLQSDRNVTVNARNHMGQLTGQLTVGADAVEAQCKRFEVRASEDEKVLFSADEDEIIIGADRLKVTGTEGAVFGHSVETPHIRAEPSQDLNGSEDRIHCLKGRKGNLARPRWHGLLPKDRKKCLVSAKDGTCHKKIVIELWILLPTYDNCSVHKHQWVPRMGGTLISICQNPHNGLESPTRSLIMEAPRGVQVSAAAGDLKATCRKELHLQSTEGEIFLNADVIRLGNLPMGSFSSSPSSSSTPRQTIYELCVCPNGKLYLSPAGAGSTCQSSSNICLWS